MNIPCVSVVSGWGEVVRHYAWYRGLVPVYSGSGAAWPAVGGPPGPAVAVVVRLPWLSRRLSRSRVGSFRDSSPRSLAAWRAARRLARVWRYWTGEWLGGPSPSRPGCGG